MITIMTNRNFIHLEPEIARLYGLRHHSWVNEATAYKISLDSIEYDSWINNIHEYQKENGAFTQQG